MAANPRRAVTGILAAVVCLTAATVLGAAPALARVPDQPPNVVGLPGGDAETLLLTTWSDRAVITFNPVGGQPPAGAEVRLAVVEKQGLANPDWQKAGAPPRVELFVAPAVPSLLGLRRGDAGALLTRHGLVLAANPARTANDWVVIRQSPEAKSPIQWGARVLVFFGPPPSVAPVKVPDLRGLTRSAALDALQAAGLTLTATGPESGRVIAQDPGPNTEVQPGTAVAVTLRADAPASSPPNPVPSGAAPPPGTGSWVPVATVAGGAGLLVLVLLLLAWLLTARTGRRPRWVRAHVRVVPRAASLAAPDVGLSGSVPSRSVRIRARTDAGSHVLEEVGS